MSHFLIEGLGGRRALCGDVQIRGAKNAALKGIAASVLFRTPVAFTNMPEIEDVARMLEILRKLGASAESGSHRVDIDARKLTTTMLDRTLASRLRASVVLTGPILARYGSVRFPHPGGCVIGERPIDLFIANYRKMGAVVKRSGKFYDLCAPKGGLRGADIFFRVQSVTGTETFMMAAVLARGTTTIRNAAMEPEISWLADVLNASGADVRGAGTPTIVVRGGKPLSALKKPFHVVSDRIEAGSFLILGALAAKRLMIRGVVPDHLGALIELLRSTGANVRSQKDSLEVTTSQVTNGNTLNIRTHEYPGFPTDLQAPMMVYLTQHAGESLVFETIFEGRLNYVESLNRMGANITMMDPHRVLVKGPTPLRGRELESPDLRAGLAFLIAGAIARGTSALHNVYNIDRGYERIEERLREIGVRITRV